VFVWREDETLTKRAHNVEISLGTDPSPLLVAFYKEKQERRGGDPAKYIEAVMISPAEELAICESLFHGSTSV